MIVKSTIIEKLSTSDVHNINNELSAIDADWWGQHVFREHWGEYADTYNRTGALRHGKTCWLQIVDRAHIILVDRLNMFPVINGIINRIAGNETVLRVFWHKLQPDESIDKHTDSTGPYFDIVAHRYQLYLDIPSDASIYMDDEFKTVDEFRYSIVDFNARAPHAYKNNSTKDLTFLVFDTSSSI